MLEFYRFHRQKWNKALASLIFFSFNCSLFAAQLSQSSTTKRSATAQQLARQGYQEIEQCDPTIHVSLMYARPDNFCGVVLYHDLREAFLHPEAMRGLQKAQAYLKQLRPDLSLKVYDAARPMHIQQRMWDEVKHTSKAIYVSNPAHGGGMHNYGMAVDITLCTLKGDTLDMGTKIDYMGKRKVHIRIFGGLKRQPSHIILTVFAREDLHFF